MRTSAKAETRLEEVPLAAALRDSAFKLNVTASASTTSVLGDALERGVGFLGQRCADVACSAF